MESSTYSNRTRKTPPKNFRGNPGDRKKTKTDSSTLSKKPYFPQSENGNKKTEEHNEVSYGHKDGQSSVDRNSSKSEFHNESPNNFKAGGYYRSSGFYSQNKHRPSVNRNYSAHHEQPHSSSRTNSSYEHPNHKNTSIKHFRSAIQGRYDDRVIHPSNQKQEELLLPRTQIVQTYCGNELDAPIKPPQMQHDLPTCSGEQKPSLQINHPKYNQHPYERETYDMYLKRPDHDIGEGRFLRKEKDLPPRFKKKCELYARELEEDYQRKLLMLQNQIECMQRGGIPVGIHVLPAASCKSNNEQNATNERKKRAFQQHEIGEAATCSEVENQIHHCSTDLSHDTVEGNSGLTPSVKKPNGDHQTEVEPHNRKIQSQKSYGGQRNFSYNSSGHSHTTEGAYAKTNTNKTLSTKDTEWENQLCRNLSKYDNVEPSLSNHEKFSKSHIPNVPQQSAALSNSQLGGDTGVLAPQKMCGEETHENVQTFLHGGNLEYSGGKTSASRHIVESDKYIPPACSDIGMQKKNVQGTILNQQCDCGSKFESAVNSQKRYVSVKETHSKRNVRTSSKENAGHFSSTPSTDKHMAEKEIYSAPVCPDVGMKQKNTQEITQNQHGSCGSKLQNRAINQSSGTGWRVEAVCQTNETSTKEQGSEKDWVECVSVLSDDQLSVSSECSANNRKNMKNLVKIRVSKDVQKLDYWKSFLEKTFPRMEFKIRVEYGSNMLSITFVNQTDAENAWCLLKEVKGKNDGNPFIKVVKCPTYDRYKNFTNKNMKILQGCLGDIKELCARAVEIYEKKTAAFKQELDFAKSSDDLHSVLVIQGRLKELDEMHDVFVRYIEAKEKEMNSEVEKFDSDSSTVYNNLLQMKKELICEYMCFKAGLPVYAKKELILDLVVQNRVSVVVAETGSGKSTQLVQYLLQNGFGKDGMIVCTQPRKVAAVSIAKYISGQIGSPVGAVVGYQVGFDTKISKKTKIVYMTDYVLLKRCVKNRNLEGISCVVVDEAHERSLFTDLLLAIIKKCLPTRPDIRIIITSATINPRVFRDYFNLSAKAVLSVPGRMFPVEIKWREADVYVGWNFLESSVMLACKIHKECSEGDILVFLTSPQETEEAVNLCQQTFKGCVENFPMLYSLHGKQDMDEQLKVFSPAPSGCRKIVFATNAAETSVTIPGVKYVIDSGMVKEKQYIAEKNRNALVVGFISKSSAEQRKGRAGRTQAGICYRLYSKKNYAEDMPERTEPEILRINLQLALLKILEFNMQPEDFDFVESPSKGSINSALHSLELLGTVKNKCFTDLGKQITKLPLDPQLGKLVILGAEEGVPYEASIIASIATVSGMVFYRNEDNRVKADKKKIRFCREEGDFLTFLDVFKEWYFTPKEQKVQWCTENCINAKAMKIAHSTSEELVQIMRYELRIKMRKGFKPADVLHSKYEKILFECFLENICIFSGHKNTGYLSPFETGSFFIHPSSSLCYLDSRFHNFVIFSSVLKTSRSFLLNVTPIKESTIISAYQKGVFPYQIDILQQLQTAPVRIYPVGQSILIREILGRQGSKLHEIEQQINLYAKTDAFHIDVQVEKGEILVYIEHSHHAIVTKLINTVIQEAQCQMAKEEAMFKIAECASSCVAVTSGGIVNDILLPGEFREVIVKGFCKSLSVDKIISKLKNYGPLQAYKEVEDHGSPQIVATYVKACDAERAVAHLQKLDIFDISSKVSYAKVSDKSLPLFRLQVTWPRFPCLGTGWISFLTDADCIEASGVLTSKSFYIGGNYILFTPAESRERVLHMKNLPSFVETQDITKGLRDHLPHYLKVKSIDLVRPKSCKLSENEVNSVKKQLFQMFSQYTPSSKLVINVRSPSASEITWTALVYFENFEDGEKALKCLTGEDKHKAKIDEFRLQIRPVLKSSLHCNMQILKLVEKNLHFLMSYSKGKGICTEFDIKPASFKNSALITFSCDDIKNLDKVRQEIRKLIKGTTLPCPGEDPSLYSRLFSKSGEEHLKSVEKNTKTVIKLNSLHKTVTIFGLENAVASAKSLISCYVCSSSNEQVKVFNLCGKRIPSGFLKALRQKYGFRFCGLIQKFNLRTADIDFVNRTLTVMCSEKTMQAVEQCLAELCVEVKKSNTKSASSDQETCPVCLDVITSDLFRLNHCGHAFCGQCLLLQLESKIIPLVCSKQGCEKPLFIEDINKLLFGNEELKKEFCQAALKNFISKNNLVHYCPMPDCLMVYRSTSTSSTEFHCPSCENDICTRCQSLYHYGMTCDMFQKTRVDEHYPLKLWMKQDSESRKKCPRCLTAIEKIDGCTHVHCTQCDTHLCWLCLRTFSTGQQVYDHMPFCEEAS